MVRILFTFFLSLYCSCSLSHPLLSFIFLFFFEFFLVFFVFIFFILFLYFFSDLDESLWDEYLIRAVPTLIVFKDGKSVFRRDARLGGGLRLSEVEQGLSEFPLQA